MRRAAGLAVAAALVWAPAAADEPIAAAAYAQPTDRYAHGVLGDRVEWAALVAIRPNGERLTYVIPDASVFEDIAPRLADIDGDGRREAWVVRSDAVDGARLEAYAIVDGRLVRRFAGPAIGRGFRWLNPVGVADFDGDGRREAAYVETPHIGGVLTVLRQKGGRLEIAARAQTYSTHKIGSTSLDLAAIADLDGDGAAEIILPNQVHDRLAVVGMTGARLVERWLSRPLPPVGGDLRVAAAAGGHMIRYRDRTGVAREVFLPAEALRPLE